MSTKSKKYRRLSKGLVVENLDASKVQQETGKSGWQFDFSTSPCQSREPRDFAQNPSQMIEVDDRENSFSDSDFLPCTPKSQKPVKRIKLSSPKFYSVITQGLLGSSPTRFETHDCDDVNVSPVISRASIRDACLKDNFNSFVKPFDEDPPMSDVPECNVSQIEEPRSPELPRTQATEFLCFSIDESEDASTPNKSDISLAQDIISQTSGSECGSPPLTRSDVNYKANEKKATPTKWFKKLSSSTKSDRGTQGSGKISEASSPSQSITTGFSKGPSKPSDSDWSSCKKKKRPRFGLGIKFDAILKKDASDRVLRNHISTKSSKLIFGNESQQIMKRQGLIEKVEQINNSILFIECRNLKLVHRAAANATFKVLINLKVSPFELQMDKIIPGNEISIESPWKHVKSVANDEDIFMEIENLRIYENES